jgi:general secretion pathway protein C
MAFDRIVKRNFGVAVLFAAGLSAFLSARGVARIAEAAVAVDAKQLAAAPLQANAAPIEEPLGRSTSARPILARNPFDSETGPLHDITTSESNTRGSLADSASAPPCDDVKVLVIAQSSDPDWSFAALSSGDAEAKSQLRRRGGDFAGKRVELVSWDRVWLSSHGAVCHADLFSGRSSEMKKATPKADSATFDPTIAKGIHKTSATQFEIDRSVVDKMLENQTELMKVRVVPEQVGGALVGIRLFGIKQGSLLAAIGLEDGDRIETLNGLALNSPEQALEAYARLRVAEHLKVQINRKGAETQIDYDIH